MNTASPYLDVARLSKLIVLGLDRSPIITRATGTGSLWFTAIRGRQDNKSIHIHIFPRDWHPGREIRYLVRADRTNTQSHENVSHFQRASHFSVCTVSQKKTEFRSRIFFVLLSRICHRRRPTLYAPHPRPSSWYPPPPLVPTPLPPVGPGTPLGPPAVG